MLVEPKVDSLNYCKKTIKKSVKRLGKVYYPWKRVKSVWEVHHKCNYSIFPAIESKEIRKSVIKPPSMM